MLNEDHDDEYTQHLYYQNNQHVISDKDESIEYYNNDPSPADYLDLDQNDQVDPKTGDDGEVAETNVNVSHDHHHDDNDYLEPKYHNVDVGEDEDGHSSDYSEVAGEEKKNSPSASPHRRYGR